MHCFSLPWKVLFATIPPVKYCGGWATFGIALTYIGLITAIVGDVAGQLGCAMGIEDMVTAISLVALGTSLPDLFASKQVRPPPPPPNARTRTHRRPTWGRCTIPSAGS
jgi:solute carrier family 8 (sodium/calcium exchanger)